MGWTLVTGGAQHLGAEICRELARRGHHLVVHYNTSADQAHEVAATCRTFGVKAEMIQGDFSTRESTALFAQQYLSRFPETQSLINNVGNYLLKSALVTSIDEWYSIFQNNLHVPFVLTQLLADSLKASRGAIVNIGVAGLTAGRADTFSTAYSCAKQALLMLTKACAKELAPALVRVNMVSPGYLEQSIDLPADVSTLPMGRPGTYLEAAQLVAYLCSPAAAYITGQNIEMAGGVRL